MVTDELLPGTPVEASLPPSQLMDLLASGHYGEAVGLLQVVEEQPYAEGDLALSTILEALRQMCLAGDNYKSEVELHRQAYQAATAREEQLRRQLLALLGLVASRLTISGDGEAEGAHQRRGIPGMLRRVQQGFLGLRENTLEEPVVLTTKN